MISKALVAASTKPLILSILLGGENYGYMIIRKVKDLSSGKLEWSDGMIYPVLSRLERDGFIRSQWKLSEGGKHRKYYTLTDWGRKDLVRERAEWLCVHQALSQLWQPLSV
jgi:PadR family transcriptional regulator, regulatory protein PadR